MKSVVECGARGDSRKDDTLAIARTIKSHRHVYLPPGDYRVTSPIAVPPNTRIVGAGYGSTRIFDDTAMPHSFFIGTDSHGVEISHLTIEGNHRGGAGNNTIADAINFFGKAQTQSGFAVHHCRIKNMTGRAIVFVRHCQDVAVHHNVIENCSIGVFLFGGTTNGSTHDNVIRHCRIGGLFVDDATNMGEVGKDAFRPLYHSIHHNQVAHCGYDPIQVGFGIGVSASYGVTIDANIVSRIGISGVIASPGIIINSGQDDLFPMQRVTISGNVVTESAGIGIFLEAVQSFTVTGNSLTDNNLWTSNSPGMPEIIVRPHTAKGTPATAGIISGNLVCKTGTVTSRSDRGIQVDDGGTHGIMVGENNLVGFPVV